MEPRIPNGDYESFDEFWSFYVTQHLDPRNRALHYVGGLWYWGCVISGVVLLNVWIFFLGALGYFPSWVGHVVFEDNRPASLGAPLWSGVAECKMLWLGLTGRMAAEVTKVMESRSD